MQKLRGKLTFLGFMWATIACAKSPARIDRQLVEILGKLKTAEGYSYEVVINTQLVGAPKEQEVTKMFNYQSQQSFISYSRSEEAIVFVCERGQFRVNPKEKAAYYKPFPTDPAALEQIKASMLAQMAGAALDSFFLSGADIESKKTMKNSVSYRLSYAPASLLKELTLTYDLQKGFFTTISYTMERPVAGSASAVISQKATMDHYEIKTPPEIAELLKAAKDMRAYLERNYQGYRIQQINH